jgi:hypothetical protein
MVHRGSCTREVIFRTGGSLWRERNEKKKFSTTFLIARGWDPMLARAPGFSNSPTPPLASTMLLQADVPLHRPQLSDGRNSSEQVKRHNNIAWWCEEATVVLYVRYQALSPYITVRSFSREIFVDTAVQKSGKFCHIAQTVSSMLRTNSLLSSACIGFYHSVKL